MEEKFTLPALIANKTLNQDIAGLLWAAVSENISFLVASLYREAGKTTLRKAMLDLVSKKTPLHFISKDRQVTEKLLKVEKQGGYLVVSEFSPADVPGYIWGEEVLYLFRNLKNTYSLSGCIHSENAEDAIVQLVKGNEISDLDASQIKLVVYIDMFGKSMGDVKRKVSEVYEVHYVEKGEPMGHLLFKWDQDADSWNMVEESHLFAKDKKTLSKRSEFLGQLASLGKTSYEEVLKEIEASEFVL